MTFPKYSVYKDSGVDWLGEVPAHWEVVKLSYLAISKGGGTPPKDELQYWNGSIPWVTPKDMKRQWISSTIDTLAEAALHASPVSMVEPGHVLIVFRSGILRHRIPAAINKVPVTVNQDVRAYNVRPRLSPDFFLRLIQGLNRELLPEWSKQGATVESLDSELVNSTLLPVPPQDEQEAITAFLDHETARIDALVEQQQRLIELLKEKRQAVISHAVTKGLDPNVAMKDSGVEWLGEIPSHWGVVALRRVLQRIEQGWSPECFSFPADEGTWGVLKAGAVNNGVYREGENKALPEGAEPRNNIEVMPGDLLMCRASGSSELIGSAAYVESTRPMLMLSDKLFRLVASQEVLPEFVALSFGSIPLRRQIGLSINGAEGLANNLSQAAIKNLKITLPPISEQRQIVSETAMVLNGLKEQVDLAVVTVELLQERRSALVSAAVTGKIDVRGWQPPAGSSVPKATQTEMV
ncbi:restriction endonuclease subunit S [Billgrantia sulfidoxydans]|uniref:Restriction endonuclease subunit S n=1 Tax=Billgrantia sulfidoxydans TaxID=2733484 RepID=A0ABX7W373_9GAMM|nr:restriction endonuclease subunit S [Halomonas sulfidoxydans]QTP54107.1 restriction endonuclease subunit S [Halomonas sulfidoxydans]